MNNQTFFWRSVLFSALLLTGASCSPTEPIRNNEKPHPIERIADAGPLEKPAVPEKPASPDKHQPEQKPEEATHEELAKESHPEPAPPEPKLLPDGGLPPLMDGMNVTLVKVVDGDTVYVSLGGLRWPYYKIRMLGFNSPECFKGTVGKEYTCVKDDEYYGLDAYKTLKKYITTSGQPLKISCPQNGKTGLECKLDPYKRSLAFVLLASGENTSLRMLKEGAGLVYTIFYPALLADLCRAEASAIREKKGMWVQGRAAAKKGLSTSTLNWYDHKTPGKSHDEICSKAMGESFAKVAGEIP